MKNLIKKILYTSLIFVWFLLLIMGILLKEPAYYNYLLILTIIIIFLVFKNSIKYKEKIVENIKKGMPVPIIITLLINWFIVTYLYLIFSGFLQEISITESQEFLVYALMFNFIPACIGILLFTMLSMLIIVKYSIKLLHVSIASNFIFIVYIILITWLLEVLI